MRNTTKRAEVLDEAGHTCAGHQDCQRGYYKPAVEPLLHVGPAVAREETAIH